MSPEPRELRLDPEGNLINAEALWDTPIDWVEEPNVRRGGWSGVSHATAVDTDGHVVPLFVKRQQNHMFRLWSRPLAKRPTFYREWRNVRCCRAWNVPTADILYYGERNGTEAILATRGLERHTALDVALRDRRGPEDRQALLTELGTVLARLHRHRRRHGALYSKHVLVASNGTDIRLIDLEKMVLRLSPMDAATRDLAQLRRGTPGFTDNDLDTVLQAYSGLLAVPSLRERVLRRIAKRDSKGLGAVEPGAPTEVA